jgi:predicted transposase/invertase (TIGR01784 family)
MKFSIVDVKCTDLRGTTYVVEMQVLNVEGFEKRVIYNASKAYVSQLDGGEDYPKLNDVVAVSICDFRLWPAEEGVVEVPLLSRWRMQEQHNGRKGLGQVQYVFLELPKLARDREPETNQEKWAYFFRETGKLRDVPKALSEGGVRKALEAARTAGFTAAEWDAYDRAKMAEQDARGALTKAQNEGRAEGRAEGLAEGEARGELAAARRMLRLAVSIRGWELSPEQEAQIEGCTETSQLEVWLKQAMEAGSAEEIFG